MADLNVHNSFLDMMRSRIWDGVPRMDSLFVDAMGGRMPGLSEEESERVLRDVCRCWFLGTVARQHKPVQVDIIPIVIGPTCIRKTAAVKWIATCEEFFRTATNLEETKFFEGTTGGLVLELGEMNAIKGMSNEYLKAFLSKATDHLREPYDKYSRAVVRRFGIIGTTNEYEFLTDPTGNRRYFPFDACTDKATLRFGEGGFQSLEAREYILQVWAEAYSRYLVGESWELSQETMNLSKAGQDAATVSDPYLDILSDLVDGFFGEVGDRICKLDLKALLEKESRASPMEIDRAVNRWWRSHNPEWERPITKRIKKTDLRNWMVKPSVTEKCRVRLHPPGYVETEQMRPLGERCYRVTMLPPFSTRMYGFSPLVRILPSNGNMVTM